MNNEFKSFRSELTVKFGRGSLWFLTLAALLDCALISYSYVTTTLFPCTLMLLIL